MPYKKGQGHNNLKPMDLSKTFVKQGFNNNDGMVGGGQ